MSPRSTRRDFRRTPPFHQLGVRQTGPESYEVVVVGRTRIFLPTEIRLPVGAEVTFIATSGDVIHGMMIPGTRGNAILAAGISEALAATG